MTKDYISLWNKFCHNEDNESFSVIYMDHYDLLFNYGNKFTRDTEIIEDSIQNIFSYFLKNRRSLRDIKNVKGYLLKCFRRQLFHDIRKEKRMVSIAEVPEGSFSLFNSPEQDLIDREGQVNLKKLIRNSIRELSPRQQEMIYMRFVFNLTYEDISEMLGINVDTCYKTIYRSIKAIRIHTETILNSKNSYNGSSDPGTIDT